PQSPSLHSAQQSARWCLLPTSPPSRRSLGRQYKNQIYHHLPPQSLLPRFAPPRARSFGHRCWLPTPPCLPTTPLSRHSSRPRCEMLPPQSPSPHAKPDASVV